MAKTCPKCHSENTDTAWFCGNCATSLGAPRRAKPSLTKTRESPAEDLAPGFVIGMEYEIIEKLGRGGMGEVYRALDRHLERQVAVKALPEEFSADPERMARFKREAKLLAALNHPNIAAVHELEESGERRFLVLELVEGETLQARLDRGAMAVEEAIETCRQVATGLEAAHEKGIVHRDLKPGNIMVTPDGQAKILDFGLAKAEGSDTTGAAIADSPTITALMTEPGVILGTAAYMSPEQARGRAVDKRTDIWAWGCVLYECLTGKRAFHGETTSDVIAQILKGEPDWSALPAATPVCVRNLLRRCLKKDRKERLHDIADARLEIEEAKDRAPETANGPRRFPLLWLGAVATVMLLAGILIDRQILKQPQPGPPLPVVTSTIKIEPGHWMDGRRRSWESELPSRTALAISHNGRFVVYCAAKENSANDAETQLFLRRLDRSESEPIPGTEGSVCPIISPDDRRIAFWAAGFKLKKIPVEGGVPTELCDLPGWLYGASWGRDDKIVFAAGESAGLSAISADGGKPEVLTKPDAAREEWGHRLPCCLPGGKAIVFTVARDQYDRQPWLALLHLDTREWRVLLPDAADARYVPTGHLVFLRRGTLMAVRFDLGELKTIGQPVPLVRDVSQAFSTGFWYNTGAGQFSISDTGSLIYAASGVVPEGMNSLIWVDHHGAEQPVTTLRFPFFAPRLSPDGSKIAYTVHRERPQVWVYDLRTGTNRPLINDGNASFPIWASDSSRLLFAWERSLAQNLFLQPHDGSAPMERLTTSVSIQFPGAWSPDGRTVAFSEWPAQGWPDYGTDILTLDVPSGRITPFAKTSTREGHPEFSPDGHWLSYDSFESGRSEVYVQPFPGPGPKHQVSSEGGVESMWARNGKQIFYRWQDQWWVSDVMTNNGLETGKPRLLFRKTTSIGTPIRCYDLSLDGGRFLMVKEEPRKPAPLTEMVLVLNWFEELKRLAPVK